MKKLPVVITAVFLVCLSIFIYMHFNQLDRISQNQQTAETSIIIDFNGKRISSKTLFYKNSAGKAPGISRGMYWMALLSGLPEGPNDKPTIFLRDKQGLLDLIDKGISNQELESEISKRATPNPDFMPSVTNLKARPFVSDTGLLFEVTGDERTSPK